MSESHGIEIPYRPPAGVVMALKEFVEEVERYDTDGAWPDNGTIRRLADQGRDALNNSPKSVDLAEKEKEVAELRKALEVEIAERDRLREQLKFSADDNILDEVKRVLGAVDEAMGTAKDHRYSDGMLHHQTHDSDKVGAAHLAVRQLLTRLGGSHE